MDVQYFLTIVIDGEPFLLHKVFDEIQYTVSEKKKKMNNCYYQNETETETESGIVSTCHSASLKVGQIRDAYLAEHIRPVPESVQDYGLDRDFV